MNNNIYLGVIGISHKTASVALREKVALSETEQRVAIKKILANPAVDGCMIVSTCNRTEVYFSSESHKNEATTIRHILNTIKKCKTYTDDNIVYELHGSDVVQHFFKVISSLDSQIIGEPQITGQVKDGYNLAHELNSTDTLLNKLFNFGLQAEKNVRKETFLSDGAVSVSFAGVELARKIYSDLTDKEVLLIGAGETAELAAVHFLNKGVRKIHITNRTFSKAQTLAKKLNGQAHPLESMDDILRQVDIVISATSSTEFVVTKAMMDPICRERRYRPVFLIDLAIPRDLDPAMDKIDGVFLFNLDDLNEIVQENLEKRAQEIPRAVKIVGEFAKEYGEWNATHSISFVINRLRTHFDTLRNNELDRLKNRLPEAGLKEIDYLTTSIMNKLMHQHIKALKKNVSHPEQYQQHVDFIYNLYELENEK
ncbi:MAG: glutamyl-tRNA reductase [Calditrichales bacterium]|nr:MAG: glutamyl-tRNA reductase [Calditrichales bacterium]